MEKLEFNGYQKGQLKRILIFNENDWFNKTFNSKSIWISCMIALLQSVFFVFVFLFLFSSQNINYLKFFIGFCLFITIFTVNQNDWIIRKMAKRIEDLEVEKGESRLNAKAMFGFDPWEKVEVKGNKTLIFVLMVTVIVLLLAFMVFKVWPYISY